MCIPIRFVFYFFSASCLTQNFLSEYLHFFPTAQYLFDDKWMKLYVVGALQMCFAPLIAYTNPVIRYG